MCVGVFTLERRASAVVYLKQRHLWDIGGTRLQKMELVFKVPRVEYAPGDVLLMNQKSFLLSMKNFMLLWGGSETKSREGGVIK